MKLLIAFALACIPCFLYAADSSPLLLQEKAPYATPDTLFEKHDGKYYVLFRRERCIRAFDSQHQLLWKADPWQCLELSGILKSGWWPAVADSVSIEAITFGKTLYMDGKEAIMIYFSERIVGAIDKRNGRCQIIGRD